jgi:hypothetical protein
MPPVGQTEEAFRLEQRAQARFRDIFSENPEQVSTRAGRIVIEHMDNEFVYDPEDDALIYQAHDEDGNPFGRPAAFKNLQQAVLALDGRGSVDRSA